MSRLSFHCKLWSLVGVVWITLAVIGFLSVLQQRHALLEGRKATLEAVLDAAAHVIEAYMGKANAGEMTLADAQSAALSELDRLRYGTDGYIFVTTREPVMLLNPAPPEMVGTYVGNLRDAKGNMLFAGITQAIRMGRLHSDQHAETRRNDKFRKDIRGPDGERLELDSWHGGVS